MGIDQILAVESGGDPLARNPQSSAFGAAQFLDATWLDVIARTRPDLIAGKSREEVLALRADPQLSKDMTAAYANENTGVLNKAGLPVTPGTTYLAHFAGPQGAVNVLKADPTASVESVLGANVIKANPFLRGMTIADMRGWADRKMGGGTQSYAGPRPSSGVPEGGPYNTGGAGVDPFMVAPSMTAPSAPNMQFPFGMMSPEPEKPKPRTQLDPRRLLMAMGARPRGRVF